jgi:adenylate cyclase
LSLSDERARGARYLVAAGDWARDIYANEDALRHYGRALAALQGCESCEREILEVHERLGDLLGLTGRRSEALRHYAAVREAAASLEPALQARLCRKIGALYWDAGERERGIASFREGLSLLGEDGEPLERAHLYQEMGRLAFRSGDNLGAVKWSERALAEAERSGTGGEAAGALAQALNTLGVARARLGREQEAVADIERSVGVALERGLLQAACRSYANLGVLYASLDPGRAIATCLTGLETAKKIGDLGFQSRLYANLAVAYCALTDRCDAEGLRAAEAAIALDRRLGQLDHLAVPLIVLGQIHQCHGDPDKALEYYREALSLAEEIREPQLLFPCYDGLATLHLDRGEAEEAERYLVKAAEIAERAGLDRDSLVVLPFLC